MNDVIKQATLRVIENMQENLGEQLTIDDLASVAMFSKFHFSRVFQKVTGLSPGRFLSAVRLREAKRLLSTTSLSVTEITHLVGYSSVGTFSSRFTSSVGISPTGFRQMGGLTHQLLTSGGSASASTNGGSHGTATLSGTLTLPTTDAPPAGGAVFAGLFPGITMEGRPVRYAILPGAGRFELRDVPPGRWHLIARSITPGHDDTANHPPKGDGSLLVGRLGPIVTTSDGRADPADVGLRPMSPFDPPLLLALHHALAETAAVDAVRI
jgi:AraC family transcriptional regulator